jgi:hypothetical protein
MAFSNFQYPDVLDRFGLTWEAAPDLFANVLPVAPSPEFTAWFGVGAPLAVTINNEKARSEWLIAPVLGEFWRRYAGRISLFSGVEFIADPAAGLTGYCDFLICNAPQRPDVVAPVVFVVEAKREDVNAVLGQCIAGMVGAARFNQARGTPADPIYGCITTGSVWKFLRLSGSKVTFDLTEYGISQVDRILGILTTVVGPAPARSAA